MPITLIDEYPWQPGMNPTCYLCNASKQPETTILHTGQFIEFEGFLLICSNCWGDGARLLGWTDPVASQRLTGQVESLQAAVDELEGIVRDIKESNKVLASGILQEAFVGADKE